MLVALNEVTRSTAHEQTDCRDVHKHYGRHTHTCYISRAVIVFTKGWLYLCPQATMHPVFWHKLCQHSAAISMLIGKWKHGDDYYDHMDDKLLTVCVSICPRCLYTAPVVESCIGLLVCYYFWRTNSLCSPRYLICVSLSSTFFFFSHFSVLTFHLPTLEIPPARQREGDRCDRERKRLLRWLDRWRAGVSSEE